METKNSDIFCQTEADNYYDRNSSASHSFFTDYLLSIFPKNELKKASVAELGIGNGKNLLFLKKYCKNVHGYEASGKAVKNFIKHISTHPQQKEFYVKQVNLAKPIRTEFKYNLLIFGFFAYYVADEEMDQVRRNAMSMLNNEGYVFIYDFITRNHMIKDDKREMELKIYKRNLTYWMNYFSAFDLMDFRLFDSEHSHRYKKTKDIRKIDTIISENDDRWIFSALFKQKRS